MAGKKKKASPSNIAVQNKKARYNYEILEEHEAGIVLEGTEVKSLRQGKGSLLDSYAEPKDDDIYLVNSYIPEYSSAGQKNNHDPYRARKLLLHAREINKLSGKVNEKGLTLVALSIYFNKKGLAKVKLGLAKGKTKYDKRETEKKRDWDRQKTRLLKEK